MGNIAPATMMRPLMCQMGHTWLLKPPRLAPPLLRALTLGDLLIYVAYLDLPGTDALIYFALWQSRPRYLNLIDWPYLHACRRKEKDLRRRTIASLPFSLLSTALRPRIGIGSSCLGLSLILIVIYLVGSLAVSPLKRPGTPSPIWNTLY